MKRRTLLQWLGGVAGAAATVPLRTMRVFAQPRELTHESVATLYEIAATVLPASLGRDARASIADKFVAWTRGYREGVALSHGYGHPRLQRSGASPVPVYIAQLAALAAEASARGVRWPALDLDTRRRLLDAALAKANVRGLPARPTGQHVVVGSDGVLFPEQRSERRLLQRDDQPRGVPTDRDHDAEARAAAERLTAETAEPAEQDLSAFKATS